MKKAFFLLLFTVCFLFGNRVFSQEYRSNHSYRNLGFTQLPTVSIGGYIDVNGAKASQEGIYSEKVLNNVSTYEDSGLTTQNGIKNRATDDITFAGEASLLFKVNGINDYGFKYGAIMELNANSTYNSWNDDVNATKAFIYGESLIGKIEFGNELGASQKMKIDAATFARGAGGINGKYLNYVNLPSIVTGTTVNSPLFILIPQHPTAHGGFGVGYNNMLYFCDFNGNGRIEEGDELACYNENSNEKYQLKFQEMENATKISYYTPEIFGFQAGVSYTPDTGNKGVSGHLSSKLDTGDIDEVLEYGITYTQTFYGLGVSASFTGQTGKSESKIVDASGSYYTFREDLKSTQYGINLTFFGLTVGGSVGNWDNSLYDMINDVNKGAGKYTTFGVAYEFAGFSASFGYFDSEFQDNKYTAYSVGIDYKVAQGFLPYIEYTNFKFKPADGNIRSNSGSVILAGFVLNF